MKIKFKEQQFQKDAVRSVIDCFKGQPMEISNYTLDKGKIRKGDLDQTSFLDTDKGFKNKKIILSNVDVLDNIKKVQKYNGLIQSKKLEGEYNLTIEMETGERVIIVMGAVNVMKPRVSGTLNKYILCIA